MSFMLRWLGLEKRNPRAGLRPHRDLELPLPYDEAYDRVLLAIERVLGANVSVDDRKGGTIDAAFGLVNNERVRCSFHRIDDAHTGLRVEAHFPAGVTIPETSRAVDALADDLATVSP